MHLEGKKVAVVGLGVSNLALVRFLVSRGALVTVLDQKPAGELAGRLQELPAGRVRTVLGPGYLDALGEPFDAVFLTPGMPKHLPQVEDVRRRGIPVSGEAPLFLELCPAPVAGITGSAGKTTTSTLVARMLEASGYRVYLGGNIGLPLIDHLGDIPPTARVVLELSSFQLELARTSPSVGVLLNLLPDHMDLHSSWEEYVTAKRHVFSHQGEGDWAVLNAEDPLVMEQAAHAPAQVALFGERGPFATGAWVEGHGEGRALMLRLPGGEPSAVCGVSTLRLVGRHNLLNALAAITAAGLLGGRREAMAEVLAGFTGVPHRLERVGEVEGVLYVNDSIATTPDRALAALATLQGPIVLIAGGYDKKLDFTRFARGTLDKVRHLILLGDTAPRIRAAVEQAAREAGVPGPGLHDVADMAQAVELARGLARPGDTVLLSPACASFGLFRDYRERGMLFKEMVQRMAKEALR